jgi:hypothetical protein
MRQIRSGLVNSLKTGMPLVLLYTYLAELKEYS